MNWLALAMARRKADAFSGLAASQLFLANQLAMSKRGPNALNGSFSRARVLPLARLAVTNGSSITAAATCLVLRAASMLGKGTSMNFALAGSRPLARIQDAAAT